MADKVPIVIVDPEDYKNILLKLNEIDEKIEFTNSEIHQRYGKKIGRDIGILYGICTALMVVVVYLLLLLSPVLPRLQSFLQSVLFK
ncbi:MAG: tetrahydromethanopterin S-methyltransferase subunit G [Candidatus Methanoperedens sp.]|jgi:tetrahydromethanopterin S-methyltransferase subunit G|nr:tetrahydromethanopterin S-methyltransferase subunit G [Candidatus Methanoperedens sp.]MCZ7384305.1 tetrahydromethanopterin S-methyltransferase subunit G [Candidatus Methanoperedens sp.]MCZ7404594.1 tetrahydromethanopterin S-methyltransferase subunit G [Candidatus Methanoperedens sp.]